MCFVLCVAGLNAGRRLRCQCLFSRGKSSLNLSSVDAIVAGHRSIFDKGFIRVAIQPAFARLGRRNNRMTTGAGMFAGVLIWRAVATQGHAASLARPQMDPVAADLHALCALTLLRLLD